jgi:hypothetical protein
MSGNETAGPGCHFEEGYWDDHPLTQLAAEKNKPVVRQEVDQTADLWLQGELSDDEMKLAIDREESSHQ